MPGHHPNAGENSAAATEAAKIALGQLERRLAVFMDTARGLEGTLKDVQSKFSSSFECSKAILEFQGYLQDIQTDRDQLETRFQSFQKSHQEMLVTGQTGGSITAAATTDNTSNNSNQDLSFLSNQREGYPSHGYTSVVVVPAEPKRRRSSEGVLRMHGSIRQESVSMEGHHSGDNRGTTRDTMQYHEYGRISPTGFANQDTSTEGRAVRLLDSALATRREESSPMRATRTTRSVDDESSPPLSRNKSSSPSRPKYKKILVQHTRGKSRQELDALSLKRFNLARFGEHGCVKTSRDGLIRQLILTDDFVESRYDKDQIFYVLGQGDTPNSARVMKVLQTRGADDAFGIAIFYDTSNPHDFNNDEDEEKDSSCLHYIGHYKIRPETIRLFDPPSIHNGKYVCMRVHLKFRSYYRDLANAINHSSTSSTMKFHHHHHQQQHGRR